MIRRLRCLFMRHEWVDGQDPMTQHITRQCSRCGARRRYPSDPHASSDDRFRTPRNDTDFGPSGGGFP